METSTIIFLLLTTFLNAQYNELDGNSYITMPNKDTYIKRKILKFNLDKLEVENITTKEHSILDYKIINDRLIVSDSLDWGRIKYSNNHIELIDKNNSSIQYTKLKTTQIDCNEQELKEIITSSYWKANLKKENSKIHIKENPSVEKKKINYMLVKLDSTYVLFMDDWWNFTISKISKGTIEFYGLAKSNGLPEKVTFIRERK